VRNSRRCPLMCMNQISHTFVLQVATYQEADIILLDDFPPVSHLALQNVAPAFHRTGLHSMIL